MTFKEFFQIDNKIGPRHLKDDGLLNTSVPHKPIAKMHQTKKDVQKFTSLKNKNVGKNIINDLEALELFNKFKINKANVDKGDRTNLGNTGVIVYKNPSGRGYILEKL